MKVFVVFALFALAAFASASDEAAGKEASQEPSSPAETADLAEFLSHAPEFVGEFQESDDQPSEYIAPPPPADLPEGVLAAPFGIPSCKLGFKIGLPICIAKCITKGHVGGWCLKSKCHCGPKP